MKKTLLIFILIFPLFANCQIDSSVYKIGITHLTNNKFKKAYRYFNKQSKKIDITKNPDILFYKAISYYSLNKNLTKTINYFNDYIKLNPNDYRAYLRRGICYYQTFYQNDKARSDFQKTLELNPFNPEANYYLADLYSIKTDTIEHSIIDSYYNQFFNLVDTTHFLFNYAHYNRGVFKEKYGYGDFSEDFQYLDIPSHLHIYALPTGLISQDTIKLTTNDIHNIYKKYGVFVSSGNLRDTISFKEFITISSLKELLDVDSVISFGICFPYVKNSKPMFKELRFTGDSFENSLSDYLYNFSVGDCLYFEDIKAIKHGSIPEKYGVIWYKFKLTYANTH